MISGYIQEQEIDLTISYARKIDNLLHVLLDGKTSEFSLVKEKFEKKVQEEEQDIEILKSTLARCKDDIKTNSTRLSEIPAAIAMKEEEIKNYEERRDYIDIPVYRTDYDSDGSHTTIDYEATERNENIINNLNDLILDCRYDIEKLNSETSRRKENLISLKTMNVEIENNVSEKKEHINSLNDDFQNLNKIFEDLKTTIVVCIKTCDQLYKDLMYAKQLIHEFGENVKKTSYDAITNSYSSNLIFSATSKGINEQIKLLKESTNLNYILSKKMESYLVNLKLNIESLTSNDAIEISKSSNDKLSHIYKTVQQNIVNLTKANDYLIKYENINFKGVIL